jgi:chemotaxis family two-component system sensor kinase Cph1
MNAVAEFFKGIFDTDKWPARWHCGYWSDFHGWLYIISDLVIWLAYFLIPAIILDYFIKRKSGIKFRPVYLLFAAFILLCGTTHFMDVVMFWVPLYRVNALIRVVTAVLSILTAIYLVRILPVAFKQQTSLELETEIGRRKEAEASLQEANKRLEAFAYVASHDLQAPLRKILIYSSMLYQWNEATLDSKSKDLITKINTSSERLKHMTTGILNLSVLKEEISMDMTPLSEAVDLALSDLEQIIGEKNASVTVGPLPSVIGNLSYLSQLFSNLIANALKFSEQTPVIKISAEKFDRFHIIKVADNGIGINIENSERIFNAFERLLTRSSYEGSGIGLAICKRIVEIHHGRIYVGSIPGEGSVFIIELPI